MSAFEVGELQCSIVVENFSPAGLPVKKVVYNNGELQLGRNEFRDVMLKVSHGKVNDKYVLRDVQIHKNFVKEGKATVKLMTQRVQLMLSNCPPDKLMLFLKALDTKLECQKVKGFVSCRNRLMSAQKKVFQEISPLQLQEMKLLHQKRVEALEKSNPDLTTPKRKRAIANEKENMSKAPKMMKKSNSQVISSGPSLGTVVRLSKAQNRILQAVKDGYNIFFTGSAGTGKSYLLKKIIGCLPPQHTFATASTGVAACHIGGITLHSFAGIGSGKNDLAACVELASRPVIAQQWRKCKHLIIDEISMIDGVFFDKMEAVARIIKKKDTPFGGIQLIFCGDFLQLPPVTKNKEKRIFTFQARSWRDCISKYFELTEVRRQSEMRFIKILQNIRLGRCPKEVSDVLMRTSRNSIEKEGILATRLCTHKEDVDHINFIHLNKLEDTKKVFVGTDSDSSVRKTVDALCPVPYHLELRIGAQVMLTKNLDLSRGLVNGARGVVISFENDASGFPVVKFMSGQEEIIGYDRWSVRLSGGTVATRKQLPLKLAWAISIHKSQGMTLDCVEMSLSRVFECGQAYVALSRAKSLDGLRVLDFNSSCVKADPSVLKFYQNMQLCQSYKQRTIEDMLLEDSQKSH